MMRTMFPPWTQIALLIGLTHTFRGLGNYLGPRRSGLLLGLPSTTALMLLWTGFEHGTPDASTTAESCLLGLVAAASVPLVYFQGIKLGLRFVWIPLLAILGYVGVMGILKNVPEMGLPGRIVLATSGLATLCWLSRVFENSAEFGNGSKGSRPIAPVWIWTYRTLLPIFYLIGIRWLREQLGAGASGFFITFPGATLAILITTHLETGTSAVSRLALSLPFGSLSMLAFLTAFRALAPSLGLELSLAIGFLIAIGCLLVVEFSIRPRSGESKTRMQWPRVNLRVLSWSPHRPQLLPLGHDGHWPWGRGFGPKARVEPCFVPRLENLCC